MNVDDYIDSLPEERRVAIRRVRECVNSHLPPGYEEGFQYGMISWFVPFTTLAETYNGQPLALASLGEQKNHLALYMMSVYGDDELRSWFESAYKKSGKKLDMGKSCVRFKTADDLPLEVIGEAISRVPVDTYVARYHEIRMTTSEGKKAAEKASAKAKTKVKAAAAKAKTAAKKPAAKAKAAAKKVVAKAKKAVAKVKAKAKAKAKKR
jgi:hypothetical protein